MKMKRSGLILYLLMESSGVWKKEVKDSFKFVGLSNSMIGIAIYSDGEDCKGE